MKKILLIDDEALLLNHTKNLINWKDINCDVIGAVKDGNEGLKCMRELAPDIVITDIVMPGMSGLEMIEKASAFFSGKFIIISGYEEFEYARRAIHIGAVDYLIKPFTATQLREAVLKCMGEAPGGTDTYESRYGSAVSRLLYAIDEHLADPDLTLTWLCENELFMNETYMGRLMQKRTGMKFSAWVTQCRLREACRLLENDRDVPVAEVAARVGFSSAKYFIDVFKKHKDISPGQYRNRSGK